MQYFNTGRYFLLKSLHLVFIQGQRSGTIDDNKITFDQLIKDHISTKFTGQQEANKNTQLEAQYNEVKPR